MNDRGQSCFWGVAATDITCLADCPAYAELTISDWILCWASAYTELRGAVIHACWTYRAASSVIIGTQQNWHAAWYVGGPFLRRSSSPLLCVSTVSSCLTNQWQHMSHDMDCQRHRLAVHAAG